MNLNKGITVYCASSDNIDKVYFDAAYALGREIASHGLPVINGGGKMGLMAATTDGALDSGGEAIGVIPRFMVDADRNYSRLTHTIITSTMAERKQYLAELAIGVIALPGGVGTLEELTEMMTARKLGLFSGKVVILNVNGYYDPLLQMLERSKEEGFTYGPDSWCVANTPNEAVTLIINEANAD